VLDRLQEHPGPQKRDEFERQLKQIDAALYFFEESGPDKGHDEQQPK
jgi:hypothetical protein